MRASGFGEFGVVGIRPFGDLELYSRRAEKLRPRLSKWGGGGTSGCIGSNWYAMVGLRDTAGIRKTDCKHQNGCGLLSFGYNQWNTL